MCIKLLLKLLLLLLILPVNAQECTLRRIMEYVDNPDYRPSHILYGYQLQIQLDTNITLFRNKVGQAPTMDLAEKTWVDLKKKTLRVQLKKNCAWSDGTLINAPQMQKGIELAFDQEDRISLPFNYFFKNTQAIYNGEKEIDELGVRVIDDLTLEFDLVSSPDLLIQALSFPIFTPAPLHIMKNSADSWPTKSIVRISSGAYQAISNDGKHLRMKPNPYVCPSVKPIFDEVDVTQEINWLQWGKYLVTNKIDVAHEVKPKQALMIIKNKPKDTDITINSRSGQTMAYLAINPSDDLLKNAMVREAMRLAIDYRLIKHIAISQNVDKSPSLGLSIDYPDYEQIKDKKMFESYGQRIIKAKLLMAKAGYGKNKHLKLVMPGKVITVSKNIETAIISMLKQIHIDVEIDRKLTIKEYWQTLENGDYQMMVTTWQADYPDPSSFFEGILRTIKLPKKLKAESMKRLNETYQIYNHKDRLKALAQIEKTLLSTNYVIPLYRFESNYLLRPEFKVLDEPIMSARNITKEGCE